MNDKQILITGGTNGIGLAAAEKLARSALKSPLSAATRRTSVFRFVARAVNTAIDGRAGEAASINHCKRNRLAALLGSYDLHCKSLPLVNCAQSRPFDDRDVDEHVLAAFLGTHEPEALLAVEPLHDAFDVGGGGRIGAVSASWEPGGCVLVWSSRGGAAPIDLEHRRNLAAFLTLTDLNPQLAFRQHRVVPGALQDANV